MRCPTYLPISARLTSDFASNIAMGGVTIRAARRPRLPPLDIHGASFVRMQRDMVAFGCIVARFHDVDLAVFRPIVFVRHPQRRPGPASVRSVDHVEEEQTGFITFLRRDPHRLSPC